MIIRSKGGSMYEVPQMQSQCNRVINYIKTNGSITSLEAFSMHITRLSGIIFVLKKRGYKFETTRQCSINEYGVKSYYAKYKLKEE